MSILVDIIVYSLNRAWKIFINFRFTQIWTLYNDTATTRPSQSFYQLRRLHLSLKHVPSIFLCNGRLWFYWDIVFSKEFYCGMFVDSIRQLSTGRKEVEHRKPSFAWKKRLSYDFRFSELLQLEQPLNRKKDVIRFQWVENISNESVDFCTFFIYIGTCFNHRFFSEKLKTGFV